jgi:hypothetical protein
MIEWLERRKLIKESVCLPRYHQMNQLENKSHTLPFEPTKLFLDRQLVFLPQASISASPSSKSAAISVCGTTTYHTKVRRPQILLYNHGPRLEYNRPAASADIKPKITSIEALDCLASPSTDPQAPYEDDGRSLLDKITRREVGVLRDNGKTEEDEPMWGFCMMLTGYSRAAKDNIDRAMGNLLRLQEQYLRANADLSDVYADETYRPMSFDVLKTRLRALHATGCVGVSVSSPESLSFATTKTTIRRSGGGAIFCVSSARQRLLEDVEEYMGIKCG